VAKKSKLIVPTMVITDLEGYIDNIKMAADPTLTPEDCAEERRQFREDLRRHEMKCAASAGRSKIIGTSGRKR